MKENSFYFLPPILRDLLGRSKQFSRGNPRPGGVKEDSLKEVSFELSLKDEQELGRRTRDGLGV